MPARMDPTAALPPGEPLILQQPSRSAPFERVRNEAFAREREERQVKPLRSPKERQPVANEVDASQVLNSAASATMSTVSPSPAAPVAAPPPVAPLTFPGGSDNGTTIPPDTAGAVGPNHVLNALNNNVWTFDRTGLQASPTISLNAFWSGLGIQGHTFDPRAVFDPYGRRFIFVTMADAESPTSSLLVAASQTDDPTQGWASHAIPVDDASQGQVWFDFPSVGFTADKITIQINLFTRNANQFAGSTIYAIDKRSLYDPPHQASVQRFTLQSQGATHVPVLTYDPAFADQFVIARWSGNIQGQGYLVCYKISGNVATGQATLSRIGFLTAPQTWDSFPPGDIGPQLAIPQLLSVGDDRILGTCYRDGKLYCCHAVMLPSGGPTRSAIQWWEIDTASWTVLNVGRIEDPAGAVFYASPSMAINGQGDLVIGHAQFSSNVHPSGAFTLRRAGGPVQPPQIFAPGLNSYNKTFGGPTNRWGDYSFTQVDPNDIDFWTVQEFADATADTWATMWTQIVIPPAQVASNP
jgi:hypothetical protein